MLDHFNFQKVHVTEKNQKYINDLLASKRKISHISLSEAAGRCTDKLDVIFQKFGGNVKKFSVLYCVVQEKQLGRWLNMMPMLEEIVCSHMFIDNEATRSIPQLKLPKLTKVIFEECQVGEQQNLIRAFPPGVIQELSWNNCFQRTKATSFLKNQLNIKKLALGDDSLAEEKELDQLDLKELSIHNCFDPPYKMFCRQRSLTLLTLKEVPMNKAMFNIICSMKQLENLKFDVNNLPPSCLVNLEKLPNLKSLAIENGDEQQLEAFLNVEMPTLEYLSLWMFPNLDDCWEIGRLLNLKSVRYGPSYDLSSIESLIESFPKIESIKISMADGDTENLFPDMYPNFFDYGVLKKLYISSNLMYPKFLDIVPFINICENLEEISIYAPMSVNFLRHFIATNPKIRKLAMAMDSTSSMSSEITEKIVDALIDVYVAPKLEAVYLVFATNRWVMQLNMELIKSQLENRFPIIVKGLTNLTLKKPNAGPMEKWD